VLADRQARTRALVPVVVVALVGVLAVGASAQDADTRGLVTTSDDASPGYTLFAPLELERTYLVGLDGKTVHTWKTDTRPGLSQYLLDDGHLLRTGNLELRNAFRDGHGAGGRVEELDWYGNLVWRLDYANGAHMQHHDVEPMPNGDVLLIAWERKTAAEALAAGRSPKLLPDGELWPDTVVQYRPSTGEVVWEWRVWDHLIQDHDPTKANFGDVNQHPERIDVNYVLEGNRGEKDWNHVNSVSYDAERDEVILSSRSFSELWIIDHATTTAEARGPAGDLKFRFGNPATTKARGARTLYVQHDVHRIPAGLPGAGHLIAFSNGLPTTRPYSSVEEITPTMVDGEYVARGDGTFAATIERVYPKRGQGRFFAAIVSSAQRLPNGDTLMADGPHGRIIEVNDKGRVVWEYDNPHFRVRADTPKQSGAGEPIRPQWIFRARRYPVDHPGLALLPEPPERRGHSAVVQRWVAGLAL
jgi:hypothetical protein